jgi:hypothetical protein
VQTVWVVIADEKPTENMHPLSQKGLKELTLLLLENIAIESFHKSSGVTVAVAFVRCPLKGDSANFVGIILVRDS